MKVIKKIFSILVLVIGFSTFLVGCGEGGTGGGTGMGKDKPDTMFSGNR